MKREFIYFKIFDKSWYEMGLTDDDLIKLENTMLIEGILKELKK